MQIAIIGNTIYTKTPAGTALTARTTPAGVTVMAKRACFSKYRRGTIINGLFSPGVLYRDDLDLVFKIGMTPPLVAPILGPGTGTQTGESIGYYTLRHKSGSTIVSESAPSPVSNTLAMVRKGRTWTLPATFPEARATHVALYAEWNGEPARFVVEVAVGITSHTEDLAALEWGAQMKYEGGIPPYTLYSEIYRHRMWYTGDPTNPDYIWFSEQENIESVDSLSFFRTTSGEAVTGIKRLGESLVIFTINTIDIITGFREEDFNVRPFSPSVGCISHFSIVNIHDRLWFASQGGVYIYDGSLKYVMDDLRDYWKDEYAANPTEFETGIAASDPEEYSYIFAPQYTTKTLNFVGFYLPFEPSMGGSGQQPWWSFDRMTRRTTALGVLTLGTCRAVLHHGSTDGYIRKMNVVANINDDSDVYNKKVTITTKLYLMDEPGGDVESGKQLLTLWAYVESEAMPWTLEIRGGDESAGEQLTAQTTKTIAASAATQGATTTWVAKTVHPIEPGKVTGRGFMFTFTVSSPTGFRWRGFGGAWTLGPAFRGKKTV